MDIKNIIKENILVFDGAMGTMLQQNGLKCGEIPEELNIVNSNLITNIHKKYVESGADIITTNTFGANEIKLKNSRFTVEEIIDSAVKNAKKAIGNKKNLIALDIGPIGQLLEPMGTLKFDEAYDIFKRQIVQGIQSGVDIILIETMTDLYEAKAAVLAAKENSNLPVFCTMTFEQNGRTFTGCTPEAMILTLEGLGVDAIGVNCSLGPKELQPIIKKILNFANVPVIIQPNRGMPRVENGKTVYDVTTDEFTKYQLENIKLGAGIVGGCCGTTDEFIRDISQKVKKINKVHINNKRTLAICSSSEVIFVDKVRIIGERLNPTGKKLLKDALINNNMDYVLKEAIDQTKCGAEILDVNVGVLGIHEEKTMVKVIKEIQSIIDIPLQIDSNNPKVIEKALRYYNGKAIINSVNGEDKILDTVLPIVKKYGASVIGLTLDEKGIPNTAEERFNIACKIVDKALSYGIKKEDIVIDCLALTASTHQKEVKEILKAIKLVKENLKVKTTLGVSNISFGLPQREILNNTFLAMSLNAGLDLPIINPNSEEIMKTINAFRVLNNEDVNSIHYIDIYSNKENAEKKLEKNKDDEISLNDIIINGFKDRAKNKTNNLLQISSELDIINNHIIPALDEVGDKYEKGIIFLPQLIQSAETAKKSFEVIRQKMIQEGKEKINKGKIILATVKGDIHDIGKNIVKAVLENYGFEIIDLGKDVPMDLIIEEAKRQNVKLIGLSALMTTTVKSMEETIKGLKDEKVNCKVFVGGAVLNKEYAKNINADYYAKDAKESVDIAKRFFNL